jgi:hypothetical protein
VKISIFEIPNLIFPFPNADHPQRYKLSLQQANQHVSSFGTTAATECGARSICDGFNGNPAIAFDPFSSSSQRNSTSPAGSLGVCSTLL